MRDRKAEPFLNNPKFVGASAEFSPDGRWLTCTSGESGREEVYITSFPDRRRKHKISVEGGKSPFWSQAGRQLFYRWEAYIHNPPNRNQRFYSVDVTREPPGRPIMLFEMKGYDYQDTSGSRGEDITPDGKRFLMVLRGEEKPQPVTELVLVQNWFEELKRLVPPPRSQLNAEERLPGRVDLPLHGRGRSHIIGCMKRTGRWRSSKLR